MTGLALWIVTAASLLGVLLNIRRDNRCWICWLFTNAAWAVADYQHGLPQQAALQAVYFALSIYGMIAWRRHPDPSP